MMSIKPLDLRLLGSLAALFLLATIAAGQDFPPIFDSERALERVFFDPEASSVVLFERVETVYFGTRGQEVAASRTVVGRIKVLGAQAEPLGVTVDHGRTFRLVRLEGRTVFPDGRVEPLAVVPPKELGSGYRTSQLSFPPAPVGSFVDYRYELRIDGPVFLEPWFLQGRRPVLAGEIRMVVPESLAVRLWRREAPGAPIQVEQKRTPRGTEIVAKVVNAPAIPQEPWAPPLPSLASQIALVPTEEVSLGRVRGLYDSWRSTVGAIDQWDYAPARREIGRITRRARELAEGQVAGSRQLAERLFAFVRDGIDTLPLVGIRRLAQGTLDDDFSAGRSDRIGKALMLETMLEAVGFEARIVWAADGNRGLPDLTLPDPCWFDSAFVLLSLADGKVFLDPTQRWLPFGRLAASFEGTPALLFDFRAPEPTILPTTPPEDHERRVRLEYEVREDGSVALEVAVDFLGHSAETLRSEKGIEDLGFLARWLKRHYADYPDLTPSVSAPVAPGAISIRARAVRPAGPTPRRDVALPTEPPTVPGGDLLWLPGTRRMPLQLPHPLTDRMQVVVRHPAGWRLEGGPEDRSLANAGGAAGIELAPGADGRSFTLRWSRRIPERYHEGAAALGALIELDRWVAEQTPRFLALTAP
jgi:hypothetical protein